MIFFSSCGFHAAQRNNLGGASLYGLKEMNEFVLLDDMAITSPLMTAQQLLLCSTTKMTTSFRNPQRHVLKTLEFTQLPPGQVALVYVSTPRELFA